MLSGAPILLMQRALDGPVFPSAGPGSIGFPPDPAGVLWHIADVLEAAFGLASMGLDCSD